MVVFFRENEAGAGRRGGLPKEKIHSLEKKTKMEIVPRLLTNQNACTVRHEPGVRFLTLGSPSLLDQ